MALKPLIADMSQSSSASGGGGSGNVPVGGTTGQVLAKASNADYDTHFVTVASGSSTVQLPAWTYTSGTIGAGLFTTDASSISATTTIRLEGSILGQFAALVALPLNSKLVLVDSAGACAQFTINFLTDSAGVATAFGVSWVFGAGSWSGKYTVSFIPGKQSAADVGLGNVDNTSDASKPVSTAQAAAIAAAPFIGGSTGSTDTLILVADGTSGSLAKAAGASIDASGNLHCHTLFPNEPCTDGQLISARYTHPYTGFYVGSGLAFGFQMGTSFNINFSGFEPFSSPDAKVMSDGGSGACLQLRQSTSLPTPASNCAIFGVLDVGGTAEAVAKDEAGNEVQLTAHPTDAPPSMYDETPGIEEFSKTTQHYRGTVTWINRDRVARLAAMLDTDKAALTVEQRETLRRETFGEYSKRTGAELEVLTWDDVQNQHAMKVEREQDAWEVRQSLALLAMEEHDEKVREGEAQAKDRPKFEEVRPTDFIAKPVPAFLSAKVEHTESIKAAPR